MLAILLPFDHILPMFGFSSLAALVHVYRCAYLELLCVLGCRVEKSTDQVIKPVNVEALFKWVDHVPMDVRRDIHKIAPMLSRLGYDPDAYPPSYGQADAMVANNTLLVKQNEKYWQRKAQDIFEEETKMASVPSADRHSESEHDAPRGSNR